jgi:hypothetical protein
MRETHEISKSEPVHTLQEPPKREEKEQRMKRLFGEIIAENVLNLMKT